MGINHDAVESLKADPTVAAIHRSLGFYYGNAAQDATMDAFYAPFVRPGDLVFDIGSHVGDRIGSFRRLGARVVAVEPQPLCIRAIKEIYAGDEDVILVEAVCGASEGTAQFYVNSENPTVSTASTEFVKAADGAQGWQDQVWDEQIEVPSLTLDDLVKSYGIPAFTKIDVEGFESSVLAGLSQIVPALSFEFTTIERSVALRCLDQVAALGFTAFNLSMGESMRMEFGEWRSRDEMAAHIRALPHEANAGDVYCLPSPAPWPGPAAA
ncbi:FkbM family methyltransferase [Actinoplanes sp. NEAU-A12]|uniref:FkbM family methyltransferase n=1 Tax=Actinoplanes sandaracinus TaxID=3045177 RepID=A0ABT6WPS2_9ACTN|nr:FkbM family methyltransferase [Actinoplanes sandaracinus]MDI6101704.1 FkbM family methyltransferase [Actinoplanes sandaracinus]